MDNMDPQVLDFLKTLPPDVQEMLLKDWITKSSQLDMIHPDRPAIRNENSYIRPRQEAMQQLPLLQAFQNQQQKRAKSLMQPGLY